MSELPDVVAGAPHVEAHNDERQAINELMGKVLPEGLYGAQNYIGTLDPEFWGSGAPLPDTAFYLVSDNPEIQNGGTFLVMMGSMDSELGIHFMKYANSEDPSDGYSSAMMTSKSIGFNAEGVDGPESAGLSGGGIHTMRVGDDGLVHRTLIDIEGIQLVGRDASTDEIQEYLTINNEGIMMQKPDGTSFVASFPTYSISGTLAVETSIRSGTIEMYETASSPFNTNTSPAYYGPKKEGTMGFLKVPMSTPRPIYATGPEPTDPWIFSDGAIATTPV